MALFTAFPFILLAVLPQRHGLSVEHRLYQRVSPVYQLQRKKRLCGAEQPQKNPVSLPQPQLRDPMDGDPFCHALVTAVRLT